MGRQLFVVCLVFFSAKLTTIHGKSEGGFLFYVPHWVQVSNLKLSIKFKFNRYDFTTGHCIGNSNYKTFFSDMKVKALAKNLSLLCVPVLPRIFGLFKYSNN